MGISILVLAIPMYFGLMLVELIYERFSRLKTYRLNDTITNINAGVLSQVSGLATNVLSVAAYYYVQSKWGLIDFNNSWAAFALLLVLQDFAYYWSHRMGHEVSLFWGAHSVHHQSEEYNLSVALRQTSTGTLWSLIFYLPLAFLGFSAEQFALANGINLLYQYWIHTEHIPKLGRVVEYVFCTPSHHRVHHGRDLEYLDKNYGGIFIVWDRLLGTFAVETHRPNYGTTKPLNSWNPVYANFAHYVAIFKSAFAARTLADGFRILLQPPGWYPSYQGGFQAPEPVPAGYQKYNAGAPRVLNAYVGVQFVWMLAVTAVYLFTATQLPVLWQWLVGGWIVLSTVQFSNLMQGHPWGRVLEYLRLISASFGALVWTQAQPQPLVVGLGIGVGLASLVYWWLVHRHLARHHQ